jgi:MFS transporter, DHA3 family, macrolide efflux protein
MWVVVKGIFKNKNFMLIISGKLISLMGNSIFEIAIIWYVLSVYKKESGVMLGLIMVMAALPTVILGSLAGLIIDRYNKRVIMLASDILSGIVVLIVVVLIKKHILNNTELLFSIGLLSVTSSMVRITVNSIIPDMFTDKELYDANGANQFIERGTSLLGYALGGGIIALIGVENAILFNGVSFMICALFSFFIRLPKHILVKDTLKKLNLIEDFKEVWSFLKLEGTLIRIVTIFTIVNFLLDPALNIAVPYVLKNIFNINSTYFGLIIAALPLGFCMGAIYFSKKPDFLRSKYVLYNSILGINTMFAIFSVPIVLSSYSHSFFWVPYYFMGALLISGIFSAAINISASVAIQRMVPDNIRGKFMGITSSLSAGLLPLGGIIVGTLIGKIHYSIIFLFTIISIYSMLVIIPKRKYSYAFSEVDLQGLVENSDSVINIEGD